MVNIHIHDPLAGLNAFAFHLLQGGQGSEGGICQILAVFDPGLGQCFIDGFDTAAAAPYTYVMAFLTNGTGCLGMLWKSDIDLTVHYNR